MNLADCILLTNFSLLIILCVEILNYFKILNDDVT